MDEDMRVALERLNNLPISTPNPFATSTNNPIITITPNIYGGTTTSNPTWTGNTTSTTATLDSYDQYPGQSLTEADYARRKADIADAVKENEEPWTDKDILAYMDKEKSA